MVEEIEEILMRKRALIKRLEERRSIKSAIGDARARGKRPVIGELKRRGLKDAEIIEADATEAARGIEEGGACAVSVLTEEAFNGTLADLKAVKLAVSIPVLRKDFIFDEFQIMESYVHGADAILLIVRFLSERRVIELVKKASLFDLECLVEIDSTSKDKLPDLREIPESRSILIGINNRNLDTLEVKLETFEAIAPEIKPKIPESVPLIAMSGIESSEDATRMFNAGADALLVGTSIMHAADIKDKVRELVGD